MASSFRIAGLNGKRLKGEIAVSGAKNAVLPALAASMMIHGELRLANVPGIDDVSRMCELLEGLGAVVSRSEDQREHQTEQRLTIRSEDAEGKAPSEEVAKRLQDIAKRFRASIFLTGPLLARFGFVRMPHPGGDVIGARPIDLFISGFEKMGVTVTEVDESYHMSVGGDGKGRLKGADIFFPFISVGATETLMMAATLAHGVTTLHNAALEPEVVFLSEMLRACGAEIEGAGTPVIRITGVEALHAPQEPIRIIPDRIEAGTYLVLSALAGSEIVITDCNPEHLQAPIELLRGAGVEIVEGESRIIVRRDHAKSLASFNVRTHEYPGFATDLQAPTTVLLTQTTGEATVFETIFEGRLNYVHDLIRMGADITPIGNHRVIVKGPSVLKGKELEGPDIRAGLAYVLASLVAEGESVVQNAYHIDRGYDHVELKLQKLGADIVRVES